MMIWGQPFTSKEVGFVKGPYYAIGFGVVFLAAGYLSGVHFVLGEWLSDQGDPFIWTFVFYAVDCLTGLTGTFIGTKIDKSVAKKEIKAARKPKVIQIIKEKK